MGMGILKNVWEEERNEVIYGKRVTWESHSSGGDGWVFEGGRLIRYYNGWCTVPAGRGVAGNNNLVSYNKYLDVRNKMSYGNYHARPQQQQQISVRVPLIQNQAKEVHPVWIPPVQSQGQVKEDPTHVPLNQGQRKENHYHIMGNNTLNHDQYRVTGNNYNINNDHYEARVGANNYTVLQPPPQNVRPQVMMVKSPPSGQQWQQQQYRQLQQQQQQQYQHQQPQQQQQQYHGKDKMQEDVDAKAEEYIRKKKQKFAQASIME